MFSATSLLVLACACAVTVNAQVDDKCSTAQIGTLNNFSKELENINVHRVITQVQLPNLCVDGENGVYALVCDNKVAPTIYFEDFNTLIVIRNGHIQGYATVDVTEYCA